MKYIIEHPIPRKILRTIFLSGLRPIVLVYSFRDSFPFGRPKDRRTNNSQSNAITPKVTKKSIKNTTGIGIYSIIKIRGNSINPGKNKNQAYKTNKVTVPNNGCFRKISLILIVWLFPHTFGNILLKERYKTPKARIPPIHVDANIIFGP